MIPLYKLEKLPRAQKLRKIAKVFVAAENRLCGAALSGQEARQPTRQPTPEETAFFCDTIKLLSGDACFSHNAHKAFAEASRLLASDDAAQIRRALNTVKHILFAETGKEQADWDFTDGEGGLDSKKRQIIEGMQVYLEDIRSPFNVGAMFRTAESFGVEKIILSPFCADPRHKRSERTAMGCIDIIQWEKRELISDNLRDNDTPIFALETGGVPLEDFSFPRRGIMIAGSEELGVSPRALEAADASLGRVSISCYGTKASLNVSVAFGIALHAWHKRSMSAG